MNCCLCINREFTRTVAVNQETKGKSPSTEWLQLFPGKLLVDPQGVPHDREHCCMTIDILSSKKDLMNSLLVTLEVNNL